MKLSLTIGFIEVIFNEWGEFLVEKLGSIYYIYVLILVYGLLIFFIFKYAFKFHWTSVLIAEILFVALSYSQIAYYKNGERMIELKALGLKTVNCIENYKKEKNDLPENLSMLSPCLSSSEIETLNQTARYGISRKDELNKPYKNEKPYKEDVYSLTMYENFMGFYYLSYRKNLGKFIYSDE